MRISGLVLLLLTACGTSAQSMDAGYDGGCTADLCPALPTFELPRGITRVAGVIWGGERGITLITQGGNTLPTMAWPDGGGWSIKPLPLNGDAIGPVSVAVLNPDDWFVVTTQFPQRLVGGSLREVDQPAIGSWAAAVGVSNDEAWFAGSHDTVGRWTRDAGFSRLPVTDAGISWTVLLDLSDGGVLRGDSTGGVVANGSTQRAELCPDAITHLARADDVLFATCGSALLWSRPDAGWGLMPSPSLSGAPQSIWAASANDVWVGGLNGQVARFDGSAWRSNTLIPGLPSDVSVTVISGSGDLLAIGGSLGPGGLGVDDHAFATVVRRR